MINNYFILIIVIYLVFTDNGNKQFDWLGSHRNNILDKNHVIPSSVIFKQIDWQVKEIEDNKEDFWATCYLSE